jgi:Tfp pilus assembly protein PilW
MLIASVHWQNPQKRSRGLSLIELMIAMSAALIVVGAVIALVVATLRSNSETVQATRLSQELRAVTEIISRDIRRARAVDDPIANIGRGDDAVSAVNDVTVTNDCILYGYEGALNGNFRAIRRVEENGVGRILLAAGAAPQACDSAGELLSSPQVNITNLTFAQNGNYIAITLEGQLTGNPNVQRELVSGVRIRSGGLPPPPAPPPSP